MTKEQKTYLAKDIMTRRVVSVEPETPLLDAYRMMVKKEFAGLPVINNISRVVGIVTEYDLISKGTGLHLPTFIKLFTESPEEDNKYLIKGGLAKIFSFTVKDVMNADPLVVKETSTIAEVMEIFSQHHRVNPIPAVDSVGALVGIISRYDVIKFYSSLLKKAKSKF